MCAADLIEHWRKDQPFPAIQSRAHKIQSIQINQFRNRGEENTVNKFNQWHIVMTIMINAHIEWQQSMQFHRLFFAWDVVW